MRELEFGANASNDQNWACIPSVTGAVWPFPRLLRRCIMRSRLPKELSVMMVLRGLAKAAHGRRCMVSSPKRNWHSSLTMVAWETTHAISSPKAIIIRHGLSHGGNTYRQ